MILKGLKKLQLEKKEEQEKILVHENDEQRKILEEQRKIMRYKKEQEENCVRENRKNEEVLERFEKRWGDRIGIVYLTEKDSNYLWRNLWRLIKTIDMC